jgi:hypothetical protein
MYDLSIERFENIEKDGVKLVEFEELPLSFSLDPSELTSCIECILPLNEALRVS